MDHYICKEQSEYSDFCLGNYYKGSISCTRNKLISIFGEPLSAPDSDGESWFGCLDGLNYQIVAKWDSDQHAYEKGSWKVWGYDGAICEKIADLITSSPDTQEDIEFKAEQLKETIDNLIVEHGAIDLLKAMIQSFKGCESAGELWQMAEIIEKHMDLFD